MRSLTLLVLGLALLSGCKKKAPGEIADAPPPAPPAEAAKPAAPDYVKDMVANFQRVYFDFDSATLAGDSKQALDQNAKIMAEHADVKIEVQGHADERGTTDYNLALGQKRADAVVKYLQATGVASTRVKVLSYGEERPLDARSTETAWAQNRRAEFVVVWGDQGHVQGTSGN